MSYLIGSQNVVAIPVYLRHNLYFPPCGTGAGKLDITVGPKQTMGRQLEQVRVEVPMPKVVLNCTLTATQGKYTFDPVSKMLAWDVGKIDPSKLPNLKGSVSIAF
jgi:AP-3 complex subunit mu